MAGPTAPTTAPTAIRAGGPLLSPVRRNIIFTALVFGVLVAATGQTIVVPALPTIVAELGSTVDQSWAVTSYLLGGTVVVVVAGKLGDLLGRNRVLLGSVVVFVVGSVLCGLSQTMTMLAISRALQGVGAGAISVTAYALAAEVVPLRDRGRYQGVLGAVFGVNTVTGPLLGGWLTDYLSWRWAFWINVPVSIAVLTVAATAVPALARPPKPVIDYLGILVIAVATTALIMATSWGGTTYAWGSATIVGLLIGAAVALGFFVWLEGRAAAAILPPRLFGSPVFAGAGRVELPVREPAVLDCLGGANLVVEDAGDVVGVDVLRAGIFAQLCELLFDSAGILNGQLSTPLEGCHRVGDLQPLSGGVDQLG